MTSSLLKQLKKRFIAAIATTVSLSGLLTLGYSHNQGRLDACNSGSIEDCKYVAELYSLKNRITNADWQAKLTAKKEANAKKKADIAAAAEASRKRLSKQAAKERAETAAAEAKFKAEGWFQLKPGIYGRWCTHTCNNATVIGDANYWLMEVWSKGRTAGDIYARVNILKNNVVVGWTNDTAYLSHGQKGILTFSKYLPGRGYSAQMTEFNASG